MIYLDYSATTPVNKEVLDSFTKNLDLEKVSLNLSDNPDLAKQALEIIVKEPRNIVNLLAYKPVHKEENETEEHAIEREIKEEFNADCTELICDKAPLTLASTSIGGTEILLIELVST